MLVGLLQRPPTPKASDPIRDQKKPPYQFLLCADSDVAFARLMRLELLREMFHAQRSYKAKRRQCRPLDALFQGQTRTAFVGRIDGFICSERAHRAFHTNLKHKRNGDLRILTFPRLNSKPLHFGRYEMMRALANSSKHRWVSMATGGYTQGLTQFLGTLSVT